MVIAVGVVLLSQDSSSDNGLLFSKGMLVALKE